MLYIAQVAPAMSSSPELQPATYVAGELLVGFDRTLDDARQAEIHRRHGSQVK